jgi:hypothetical protein
LICENEEGSLIRFEISRICDPTRRLLEQARRNSARSVNAIMTATYWEVGRRIVAHEQRGKQRAQFGKALLRRLAEDLTARFGRGFSERNLLAMREFYLAWSGVAKDLI